MDSKPIYKTAAELGIEQWEHDGLVALVGPLSRDELAIDMHCGTAACIGGYVYCREGRRAAHSVSGFAGPGRRGGATEKLYWPKHKAGTGAWLCSATQAARAVVNFLVTGDPQWNAVMSGAA